MPLDIEITDGLGSHLGREAALLHAVGTACMTLDWPLPPDDADGELLPEVVARLSRALAACGHVAFRHDEQPAAALSFHPPRRPAAARLRDALLAPLGLANPPFALAIAARPAGVAELFAYGGWSFAVQAALVFDPDADPAPILAALRHHGDWRRRPLPPGARLLFAPGHDGAFAVAAGPPEWLARFKAALAAPPSPRNLPP